MSSFPALTTQHFVRVSVGGSDVVRLTAFGTLANRLTSTTFDHCQCTVRCHSFGDRSWFVTRVGVVVVGVGVCNVSVAVLGETDSTATVQLHSQIGADRLSLKLRRQHPRSRMWNLRCWQRYWGRLRCTLLSLSWLDASTAVCCYAHRNGWCQSFRHPQ